MKAYDVLYHELPTRKNLIFCFSYYIVTLYNTLYLRRRENKLLIKISSKNFIFFIQFTFNFILLFFHSKKVEIQTISPDNQKMQQKILKIKKKNNTKGKIIKKT